MRARLRGLPWCCSVRRNICYGLDEEDGIPLEERPTQEEIEEAAKQANAHEFIMALPQGYDMASPSLRPCFLALQRCWLLTCFLLTASIWNA